MNDWETGPDAAREGIAPPRWMDARISLLFGPHAEVTTPYHPVTDPLRVPAVELAAMLGITVASLPGRRFRAAVDGEQITAVQS
ncbi:hypothetical protein [Spongiactinospora gelatinilytica]|nr:hypothetical protein [Spongiactinospora gelatinilytica]